MGKSGPIRELEYGSTRLTGQRRIAIPAIPPRSCMCIRRNSLVERTAAAGSTAARLRVVSKCAFSGGPARRRGRLGQSQTPPLRLSPTGLLPSFLPVLFTINESQSYEIPPPWAALRKKVPPKVYYYGLLCGFALFLCPVSLKQFLKKVLYGNNVADPFRCVDFSIMAI